MSYLIKETADWQINNQVLQVESIIPPSRETLQKTIPLAEVKFTNFFIVAQSFSILSSIKQK